MGLIFGQLIPQFALPDRAGKLFKSNKIVGKNPFGIFFMQSITLPVAY